MSQHDRPRHSDHDPVHPRCCGTCDSGSSSGLTRRSFLGAAALGGVALGGLSWSILDASETDPIPAASPRRPLVVKPILIHTIANRRPQRSWRNWGGLETQAQADEEKSRITGELGKLAARADFPVQFLPVAAVRSADQISSLADARGADVFVLYAAGGGAECFDAALKFNKPVIFFLRHRSGPLYLWYEIISPRYLRQHTDNPALNGADCEDVVVDSQDEVLWRLRALGGLRNTVGSRILAVGGPAGWAHDDASIAKLARERWQLDIRTVSYDELGKLITQAMQDAVAVRRAKARAADYLKLPGTKLETDLPFVGNAFLLEEIFRKLMRQADCRAITINMCMSVIMPLSQTTACLPLSVLNDAGYLAFCESDFVVIPAGMLLANIAGKPVFLNDPTYPHDGVITLAHCTSPRRMDGKNPEPARIVTHFESDYGASPKVDMKIGQTVTNVIPDFDAKRWLGFSGKIVENPFLPICRSQIEVEFAAPSATIAERMPGFHWITSYGDYLRELGYALKRVPIEWECLG
jgi:hypothetical protein